MKSIWATLSALFKVMPPGARGFYVWYSVITSVLAGLDALALGLIVAIVTPLASGGAMTLPFIGELPESATLWVIAIVCALFVLKSVLAILLHWYATRRFARYELMIGDELFRVYTHSKWEDRARLSTAEVTRIVDTSMASANIGFVLPLSQIPGNALTFVSVLAVLVVAQPMSALIAIAYLGLIGAFLALVVTRKAQNAGTSNRETTYRVATIMTEMVDALKEVTLRGKLDEVGSVVSRNRSKATRARANISFLANVPKYVFEAALIGGFVLIGGAAYLTGGMGAAMVSVSLFAATGFRMLPAMTGLQAAFASAASNEVYARDVIREIGNARAGVTAEESEHVDTDSLPEKPKTLQLKDVTFQYASAAKPVLEHVSLSVPFGSSLAVVGPSGAGKSTLIDLLLGLSVPTEGEIVIDDVPLNDVLSQWRSHVGYVPQRVALFDGSVAQNVALTWEDDCEEGQVLRAMERAQISELAQRSEGINALIGERGQSISGGQQQRLGIARALYSDPLVVVMDEATSALDTATENRVTESLNELKGQVTFVTVAHRLATIREYDQICYLDRGQILGRGTFAEVIEQVPDFRRQAELAGLI